MNDLYCTGCKVYFKSNAEHLSDAVDELEWLCHKAGIEIAIDGYMRLTDEAGKVLEDC